MDFIYISHCVYQCDYHIVIATKYRKNIFNEGIFAYFDIKLAEIKEHYPMINIKEVNHDKDHLHLLVSIPPTIAVGKVVGIIKQNTARFLKQKFPFLKNVYWGTESIWSEGYLAIRSSALLSTRCSVLLPRHRRARRGCSARERAHRSGPGGRRDGRDEPEQQHGDLTGREAHARQQARQGGDQRDHHHHAGRERQLVVQPEGGDRRLLEPLGRQVDERVAESAQRARRRVDDRRGQVGDPEGQPGGDETGERGQRT